MLKELGQRFTGSYSQLQKLVKGQEENTIDLSKVEHSGQGIEGMDITETLQKGHNPTQLVKDGILVASVANQLRLEGKIDATSQTTEDNRQEAERKFDIISKHCGIDYSQDSPQPKETASPKKVETSPVDQTSKKPNAYKTSTIINDYYDMANSVYNNTRDELERRAGVRDAFTSIKLDEQNTSFGEREIANLVLDYGDSCIDNENARYSMFRIIECLKDDMTGIETIGEGIAKTCHAIYYQGTSKPDKETSIYLNKCIDYIKNSDYTTQREKDIAIKAEKLMQPCTNMSYKNTIGIKTLDEINENKPKEVTKEEPKKKHGFLGLKF
jgi:hypothetical protein